MQYVVGKYFFVIENVNLTMAMTFAFAYLCLINVIHSSTPILCFETRCRRSLVNSCQRIVNCAALIKGVREGSAGILLQKDFNIDATVDTKDQDHS